MLLDGALRFTRLGRQGLEDKNYDVSFENIIKAKDILLELINILRPDVDPDLCSKLSALYTYMFKRLTEANMTHEVAIVDEVVSLLEYERETWVLLMDKIQAERASGGQNGSTAPAQPASAPHPPAEAAPRLSLEG
jgi:flagellar protein FliS